MMTPDSSSPRRQLSPEAIGSLEAALQKYLVGEPEGAALQPTLREISAEARERGIHAEQMIVLLKDLWFQLPEIRSAAPGDQQPEMLQRAVTLCIREYYAP